MVNLIFSSIYFFLPAYAANMAPVFAGKLHLPLGTPISRRYLGTNKTWRGLYAGLIGSTLVLFMQRYFQDKDILESSRLLDYSRLNLFFYGFLFGEGAIGGDLLKSFLKRRVGIKEGASWFPFDQLDFVTGALFFTYPFYHLGIQRAMVLVSLTPILHLLSNILGYWLRLKDVWW